MRTLPPLSPPYLRIVKIERYVCQNSVVVIFRVEDGQWFGILTPYN